MVFWTILLSGAIKPIFWKRQSRELICSRSEVARLYNFLLQTESWNLELWSSAPGVNSIDCRVVALALELPNDQFPTLLRRRWCV